MNTKKRLPLLLTLALLVGVALAVAAGAGASIAGAPLAPGGSPTVIAYQGEVRVADAPYTGDGYLKFAIISKSGSTSYWSNDGTSTGGGEPTAAVKLAVGDGLFGVLLGDTTLAGMNQALAADVFDQPDRYLRVWFSTSESGTFDLMSPDSRIAAVPYALQAQLAVDADTLDGEQATAFADATHAHVPGDISPQGAASGLDADTVDGLHASQLQSHYQNVVVVAKSGGDYASVQAALDSISDAAADNAYLIWVAPGVYQEQVVLKPHVHLQGAGEVATVITSTASGSDWQTSQATLKMASNSSLRDLTVGNSGSGDVNTALLATTDTLHCLVADVTVRAVGNGAGNRAIVLRGSGTDVLLEKVDALADNGSNYGIGLLSIDGALTWLRGGSFVGRGGNHGRGIYVLEDGTTVVARDVTAVGEDGDLLNVGLGTRSGATVVLRGGFFVGRGGDQTGGASNTFTSTLTAQDIVVLVENGVENYGLANYKGATMTVHSAVVTARGGTNNYALTNEDSVTLDAESITALAEDGSGNNHGFWNVNNAQATVHGGSFTGRGGSAAYGIYASASDTELEAHGVTALGENGVDDNYGLWNSLGQASLYGGSFTARGGDHAEGLYNSNGGGTLEAVNVTALGENGVNESYGLGNHSSTATVRGGSFTGRGEGEAWGIWNGFDGATMDVVGVTAMGENGISSTYGVHNHSNAIAHITHSMLEGATHSVFQSSGAVTVSHSLLAGEAVNGTVTCVAVSRGSTFSASSCP